MIRRAIALAVASASLAACVSAQECAPAIPADVRADVMRFVVDRNLVDVKLIPREDYALGLGGGRPYAQLDDDRRRRVAMYASGYVSCVKERAELEE